jgi:hypothetical protein
VRTVRFRFMNLNREWVERWPASDAGLGGDGRARPAAIEVLIELEDWGEIRRIVEVSG